MNEPQQIGNFIRESKDSEGIVRKKSRVSAWIGQDLRIPAYCQNPGKNLHRCLKFFRYDLVGAQFIQRLYFLEITGSYNQVNFWVKSPGDSGNSAG